MATRDKTIAMLERVGASSEVTLLTVINTLLGLTGNRLQCVLNPLV